MTHLDIGEQDDLIPNILDLKFSFNPKTGVDLALDQDPQFRVLNGYLSEVNLSNVVEFDGVLPSQMWPTESESKKRMEMLQEELEYELLAEQDPENFAGLQNLFWNGVISEYERDHLIESLVQNDISPSYDIDILTGKINHEICDYFPANFKKVQDSKSEVKVPNFRENEITYRPMKVSVEEFRQELGKIGKNYLDCKILTHRSL